jgi:two-component system chemotaxis response regulator CheB
MTATGPATKRDMVVIGASTGGIDALPKVLGTLPDDMQATVVVVQHRANSYSQVFLDILRRHTRLPVEWADQGARHAPGHIYVAPADVHLTFSDGHFNLTASARENHARPSINRLFRSAAAHYGSRTVGVLMTGMLDDGVAGMVAISRVGGATLVQDPSTAMAPDLPRNALAAVPTSRVVPLQELGAAVVETIQHPAPPVGIPEQIRLESQADHGPSTPELLDQLGERHTSSCSECGGPMWHVKDGGPPRYRCYLGHAMSANARLAKYDDEVELALWNAVRALNERATTLGALASDARARQDGASAGEFDQQSRAAKEQARLAYEFMQSLTRRS